MIEFENRKAVILALGFSLDRLTLLEQYIELLWSSNEELNLISRKMTLNDLIDNHIVDCLLPLKEFPTNVRRVADFGSGGGLPAVIYAIQFPQIEFHLFEKSPKKQEFLTKCSRMAPNLRIHGDIPLDLGEIDLVTARGFKPIDVIIDVSRKYYAKNGRYFLLKARLEKIQEELVLAKKKFKNVEPKIIQLKSPILDVERNLVLL